MFAIDIKIIVVHIKQMTTNLWKEISQMPIFNKLKRMGLARGMNIISYIADFPHDVFLFLYLFIKFNLFPFTHWRNPNKRLRLIVEQRPGTSTSSFVKAIPKSKAEEEWVWKCLSRKYETFCLNSHRHNFLLQFSLFYFRFDKVVRMGKKR